MSQLTRAALSADVIASLIAGDGRDKWLLCVEADFGSKVATDENGEPDTALSWNGTDLVVQTSIDDGRTWQNVPPAQTGFVERKIPGLLAGMALTNRRVLNRIFFPRPTSQLTSIHNRVTLQNGDDFEATAANADLESPGAGAILTLGSHGVVRVGGRVRPQAEAVFDLRSGGGAQLIRRVPEPEHTLGPKTGTHVSRGGVIYNTGLYIEFQDPEDPDRFTKAAMGFEAWVYFDQEPDGRQAICSWMTTGNNALGDFTQRSGSVLYVEGDGEISRLAAQFELGAAGTLRFNVPQMRWAGQWHHVAMSYDGLGLTLYIDGQARGVYSLALETTSRIYGESVGHVLRTDGDFRIGNASAASDHPLGAFITEARLWGRAINPQRFYRRRLSAAEAAELRASDDLAACWPLTHDGDDIAGGDLHLSIEGGAVASSTTRTIFGLTPPRTSITPGNPPVRVPFWDLRMLDLRVDSDTLRLCSGTSSITFPDGRTFAAAGDLLGVGDGIRERGEVDPDVGMTFTLTGLDPQLRAIAANAVYQDRPIRLYLVTVSENGRILGGDTVPVWEGRMDQMIPLIRTEGDGASKRVVLTIGVKAETHLRDFDRASTYRWADESHRAIYPDDYGFSEVAKVAERQELWPRLSNLEESEAPE